MLRCGPECLPKGLPVKNMSHYDDLADRDLKNLLHPQTNIVDLLKNGPQIIESGNGIRIKDAKGHTLIDGMAGLWCVNVGYGRKELAETFKAAAENLSYFHSFTGMSNPPEILLAEKLIKMAPGDLTKVFFGCSGSDANDTLMKVVWHYHYILGQPEKKKIISRKGSYHGTSISSASLTGLTSFHKPYNLPLPEVLHTEMPHYYRDAREGMSEDGYVTYLVGLLEEMIMAEGPETVGAFIAEPITGAGGVIAPPKGYFEAVQKVLRKYDILMIADEVICGFGRLGANWGSEIFNIKPDMLACAKGLTSGYFPLSGAFVSEAISDVLVEGSRETGNFAHGYTYSGHPIGCVLALKNLEIIEQEGLVENARVVGAYLHEQLNEVFKNNPHVGEVRGRGLLAGIQLMADAEDMHFFKPAAKIPHRIKEACYERGLISRGLPTVTSVALSPPLVVTKSDIDEIVDILKASFDDVLGNLSRDDLIPAE